MKNKATILLYCNQFSKRLESSKLENEAYWTVEFANDCLALMPDGTIKGNTVWKELYWMNLEIEPLYEQKEVLPEFKYPCIDK